MWLPGRHSSLTGVSTPYVRDFITTLVAETIVRQIEDAGLVVMRRPAAISLNRQLSIRLPDERLASQKLRRRRFFPIGRVLLP